MPASAIVRAHVDTVFGPEVPLTVTRDGDALVGPGVGDNAAAVMALSESHLKLPDTPYKAELLKQMVNDEVAQFGTHFDRGVVKGFNDFLLKNHRIKQPFSVKSLVWPETP